NSTTFDLTVTPGSGGGVVPVPLPPLVTINPVTVNEDGSFALDVTVTKDPLDPSVPDPTITVVLTGIPLDAVVTGAFFNTINNSWVTDAATISSGGVVVTPAENFSGPINFTVDAIATNIYLQQADNSGNAGVLNVTPVADLASIVMTTPGGDEDSAIPVNIALGLGDLNGTVNEQFQEPIVVTVGGGATLSGGTAMGGGVYHLTLAELAGLTVTSASNNGNDIPISIAVTTVEPANGDTQVTTYNSVIPVTPVADAPLITVFDVSGNEDTRIALTGLSALLVDTDGSETLSVTISGVLRGSILSAGANNGDGSWTIPVADLPLLTIKPPRNFSGDMELVFTAYSIEATGSSAMSSATIHVTVLPVADRVVVTPLPQSGNEGEAILLNLNIRPGDANGTRPGENPAETVSITLTGMTAGLVATASGGTITHAGGTTWTFTGSVAEANSLAIVSDGVTGSANIGVAVSMVDGISTSAPVNVTVPLTINAVADLTLTGTAVGEPLAGAGGNDTIDGFGGTDTITGGAGVDTIDAGDGDDTIMGGLGADIMTGGIGADTYIWQAIDILSGAVDTITDFAPAQNDVLDLSNLLTAFNPGGGDVISDFVNLSESAGNTAVQIDQTGSGSFTTSVATLSGVTGLDLALLYANGNLAA
ncbi:MAG: type I secretion C-terminal target domain-containing protein, partial [Phyllobacteriaceae bacterium]|nr:type I secretion C-terminal target domain-containing protein [Phyllobacteriaceae bacterium]